MKSKGIPFERGSPLKTTYHLRTLCTVLLIYTCSISIALPITSAADDDSAILPPRNVGDWWTFTVDYKGEAGMMGTITTTVTSITQLGDKEYFEFITVGGGTIYGTGVYGNWSMTVKEYYGKSDFLLSKMTISQESTVIRSNGSTTTNQQTETNYNPPFGPNSGFPLSLGKTWAISSSITQTTTITADGQPNQSNSTFEQTTNYEVTSVGDLQTQAGTFKTYLIKGTAGDGSIQEMYYAPNARIQVKEVDYDSAGNIIATMELSSCNVANVGDSSMQNLTLVTVAVLAIVLAMCLAGVFLLRRRSRKESEPVM